MKNYNVDVKKKYFIYLLLLSILVIVVMSFTYFKRISFKLDENVLSLKTFSKDHISFIDSEGYALNIEVMGDGNLRFFSDYYFIDYKDMEILSDSREILKSKWILELNGREINPLDKKLDLSKEEKSAVALVYGVENVMKYKNDNILFTSFILSLFLLSVGLGFIFFPENGLIKNYLGKKSGASSKKIRSLNKYMGIILITIGILLYPIII